MVNWVDDKDSRWRERERKFNGGFAKDPWLFVFDSHIWYLMW